MFGNTFRRLFRRLGRNDNRLYLHIGTHKTGSTSFQQSVLKHREAFPYRVWSEEVALGASGQIKQVNAVHLAHSFIREELQTVPRLKASEGDRLRDKHASTSWSIPTGDERTVLRRKASTWCQRELTQPALISAEAFCLLTTSEEKRLMKQFFDASGRRPIVVVVRRQDADWRASREAQVAHALDGGGSAQTQVPDSLRTNGDWYYDFSRIEDFWGDMAELRVVD